MEGEIIGTREIVHSFDEIITTTLHLDKYDVILFCGSPHLFFWNVPERRLLYTHKIQIPVEPWFLIWDAVYVKSKQTLVLSLNNGFVLQLNFNVQTLSLEDMKVFQSNESGSAVYNLAYFPSVDKILATNNDNLLTEFIFQIPKKPLKKALMMGSNKNLFSRNANTNNPIKTRSIRNISMFDNVKTFKAVNSGSTNKNK